jgi:hypothetical protein
MIRPAKIAVTNWNEDNMLINKKFTTGQASHSGFSFSKGNKGAIDSRINTA